MTKGSYIKECNNNDNQGLFQTLMFTTVLA